MERFCAVSPGAAVGRSIGRCRPWMEAATGSAQTRLSHVCGLAGGGLHLGAERPGTESDSGLTQRWSDRTPALSEEGSDQDGLAAQVSGSTGKRRS